MFPERPECSSNVVSFLPALMFEADGGNRATADTLSKQERKLLELAKDTDVLVLARYMQVMAGPQCCLNVPSMFSQCSLNVLSMFSQCSLNALHVPCMFPGCSSLHAGLVGS
jgi:hypothetical protein